MGFATKLKIVAELNQASLIIVPLHNQRNMVADAIKLEKQFISENVTFLKKSVIVYAIQVISCIFYY